MGERQSTSHESHKTHLDLHNATLLHTSHVFDQNRSSPALNWRMHLQRVFTESPYFVTRENMQKTLESNDESRITHEWLMNTQDILMISHAKHFLATSSCFKWIAALLASLLIDHFARANLLKVETTILYMLALSAATLKELDCEHLGPTIQNCVAWKIKHRKNWCLCAIFLQQLCNLIMTSSDGMW